MGCNIIVGIAPPSLATASILCLLNYIILPTKIIRQDYSRTNLFYYVAIRPLPVFMGHNIVLLKNFVKGGRIELPTHSSHLIFNMLYNSFIQNWYWFDRCSTNWATPRYGQLQNFILQIYEYFLYYASTFLFICVRGRTRTSSLLLNMHCRLNMLDNSFYSELFFD